MREAKTASLTLMAAKLHIILYMGGCRKSKEQKTMGNCQFLGTHGRKQGSFFTEPCQFTEPCLKDH